MVRELERGTRFGRYDLLVKIGRGGMASVWVAHEHAVRAEDSRIVAVKTIHSNLAEEVEFVKMFLDEGQLVSRIRHPSVVDLYEVGEIDGVVYMTMEWVEGDSLHALIAEAGKRRPIPPEMAVRIIADAAAGLHAAHGLRDENGVELNVVHRDVSPHNILISTSGRVKLVDFGVAKARLRASEATEVGHVKGKFGYMSPEQALARPVDRRSDVFSLGIVLYELTTGRRLFRGESDAETLSLVVKGEIPPLTSLVPDYPLALERIAMKALSRSRRERFQSARDFQRALERYLKDERIVVPRAGIAGLLRKVLGDRIEARRQAVRGALRSVAAARAGLVSEEPAFRAAEPEGEPSVSGLSNLSSFDRVVFSGDAPRRTTELTGSFDPSRSESVRSAVRRSRALGLGGVVIGVIGFVVAGAALAGSGVPRGCRPADPPSGSAGSQTAAALTTESLTPPAPSRAVPAPSVSVQVGETEDSVAVEELAPEAATATDRGRRR
ncbi:MAG: serine/threonine protein kinase [Polyangiaceae bacterium]|nr:serine/threonine protein kinase [Polyangiaceae bacterium]